MLNDTMDPVLHRSTRQDAHRKSSYQRYPPGLLLADFAAAMRMLPELLVVDVGTGTQKAVAGKDKNSENVAPNIP